MIMKSGSSSRISGSSAYWEASPSPVSPRMTALNPCWALLPGRPGWRSGVAEIFVTPLVGKIGPEKPLASDPPVRGPEPEQRTSIGAKRRELEVVGHQPSPPVWAGAISTLRDPLLTRRTAPATSFQNG